jgi:guanine nucleotide-binding protein G(i) subunit alpha
MGICGSTSLEHQLSCQIDRDLKKSQIQRDNVTKLLLLGAGGSGKSTVMRQFKMLYTSGFVREERMLIRNKIRNNIVQGLQVLVQGTRDHEDETAHIAAVNHPHIDTLFQFDPVKQSSPWSAEMTKACVALFKDPAVLSAEEMSSKLQLEDSIRFFRQHTERVGAEDYLPTDLDIAHVRIRTTGVHPLNFIVGQAKFLCVDVGGQRNERRKWISQFDNVDAVLFVVSSAAFDMTLIEERTKNRAVEALELFEEICHSPYFLSTDIILFLNKEDLLREKLDKGIQVSDFFTDYEGDNSYSDVIDFFTSLYKNAFRRAQNVLLGSGIEILVQQDSGRMDGLPARFSDMEQKQLERVRNKSLEEYNNSADERNPSHRTTMSGDPSKWTAAPRTGGMGLDGNEREGVRNKQLYIHVTHATDQKNIEFTFRACQDIILRSNLAGLMM